MSKNVLTYFPTDSQQQQQQLATCERSTKSSSRLDVDVTIIRVSVTRQSFRQQSQQARQLAWSKTAAAADDVVVFLIYAPD